MIYINILSGILIIFRESSFQSLESLTKKNWKPCIGLVLEGLVDSVDDDDEDGDDGDGDDGDDDDDDGDDGDDDGDWPGKPVLNWCDRAGMNW